MKCLTICLMCSGGCGGKSALTCSIRSAAASSSQSQNSTSSVHMDNALICGGSHSITTSHRYLSLQMHLFPLTVPVCVFDPSNTSLTHVFLTPGAGLCHRWHASIGESHNIDNLTCTKFSNPIHQDHLSVTAICDVALALLKPTDKTW